jgi:hypothetical protein
MPTKHEASPPNICPYEDNGAPDILLYSEDNPTLFPFRPDPILLFRLFVHCSELSLGLFLAMIYDLRMMMGDGRSCLVANHFFHPYPPRLASVSPARGISQQLICRIDYFSLTLPTWHPP